MNKDKWDNPEVPLSVLIAKLAEETGEVANLFADQYMKADKLTDEQYRARLIEEAEHVKFICQCIMGKARFDELGN